MGEDTGDSPTAKFAALTRIRVNAVVTVPRSKVRSQNWKKDEWTQVTQERRHDIINQSLVAGYDRVSGGVNLLGNARCVDRTNFYGSLLRVYVIHWFRC